MKPSRSQRKRQTRLDFTPAPSSSPHKSEAFVRIEDNASPAKKRKTVPSPSKAVDGFPNSFQGSLEATAPSSSLEPAQLPTPAASSQINGEATNDEIPRTTTSGQNTQPPIRGSEANAECTSSSADDGPVVSGSRRRKKTSPIGFTLPPHNDDSGASSPEPSLTLRKNITPPKPRSGRSFILGGGTYNAPLSKVKARRASSTPGKERRERSSSIDSATTDDDYEEASPDVFTSKRTLRSSARQQQLPIRRSPQKKADEGLGFSGSESDHVVATAQRKAMRSPLPPSPSVSVVIPDRSQDSSLSDVPITPSRKRIRRRRSKVEEFHPDESDLEQELADLRDTEVQTSRSKATERQKKQAKLDELRRRRAGVVDISDDSDEFEADDDSFEEEPEVSHEPLQGTGENLDAYEEDFLDDDANGELGVDTAEAGVPLHLTRFANMKPFEYFKYEVEWMVHNKLNPAFDRHDGIYEMAHEKLNDEITGHAGSTYKSAAWNVKFSTALQSWSDMYMTNVPTMFEHKCDACNRSGHPPKHKITLTGAKYDKATLEKITDDSDDDIEDDESDTQNMNEQSFFLGRFCAANAEMAHALYHWRFQLNLAVVNWLSDSGHLTAQKIVDRESWNRKKREKLANRIVDGLVASGEMKILYRQFKQNLDAARTAKVRFTPSMHTTCPGDANNPIARKILARLTCFRGNEPSACPSCAATFLSIENIGYKTQSLAIGCSTICKPVSRLGLPFDLISIWIRGRK